MKKLLLLLPILILSFTTFGQGKRIRVPQTNGEWYYTASKPFPAQPGDTVLLDAEYGYFSLNDVHGLPGKEIVFIGVAGKTKVGHKIKDIPQEPGVGRGSSIITQRCSYVKFFNIKAGNEQPGIYNAQGWNIQGSHNIEIGNVEIYKSETGFFTNQLSGHYPNIYIHDVEGHDINNAKGTAFGELFYVGQTSGKTLLETSLPNLKIENVKAWNIGGDVIQLANCSNAIVRNVTVDGYGLNRVYNQWYGLLVGGGTSGLFENLHFKNGGGKSFEILGTGTVTIQNCTSINCGWVNDVQDAFYIRESFPTLKVNLYNNRVDRKSRNWVYVATPGVKIDSSGNVFGGTVIVPPVVIPPVRQDSVTKASYDSLLAKYQVAVQLLNACVSLREECYKKNKDLNLTIDSLNIRVAELEAWKEETIKYVNRK